MATHDPSRTMLVHRSLPESVHAILRFRILNNEIPAGAPLLEMAVAEEFGVSRTTVRAAMRELQAERLIDVTPRRGATVARMSAADVREVCYARYTLEVAGLKDLTRPRRRELADRMEKVVQLMNLCQENGDVAGIIEADTDLHRLIVESSQHRLIVEMWSGLNAQMGALMRSSLELQRIDLTEMVRRHAELVQVFRERTSAAVVHALFEHYVRPDDARGDDVMPPAAAAGAGSDV